MGISNVFWGLSTVAATFFLHIFLVTVVLGLSIIIPVYEITGYLRDNDYYVSVARRLTSYLIRVDLFAGVMATWLTVFLGAYWPSLVYIATNVLLYPVSLAVAGIMIAIVSMALYWYTWDKMGRAAHVTVGLFMAAGALMVPFGMNSIISLMDYPFGVKVSTSLGLTFYTSNGQNPLLNPVFLPLALFTWFVSIALTSFIVLVYINFKSSREGVPAKNGIPLASGIISSVLSLAFLYVSLSRFQEYSPYIWSGMRSDGMTDILLAIAWVSVVFSLLSIHRRVLRYAAPVGALFSYALFMLFEISSNVSRYPYMIVEGNTGITAETFANPLYGIPVFIPVAGFAIIAMMSATFALTLYLAFFVYPVENDPSSKAAV